MRQLRPDQGTPLQNLKIPNEILFLVSWFIVLLNVSKRLSEVRYFEIKWICWHMRQIKPKTGESLVLFPKTLIKLYLLCLFLYYLTYFFKEVIKVKIFWRLNEEVPAYEVDTSRNIGIYWFFLQNTDPIVFVLFISLFFYLPYQRGYQRKYFWT